MSAPLPRVLKIVRDQAEAAGPVPEPAASELDEGARLPLPKLTGEPMTFRQHSAAVVVFACRAAMTRIRRAAKREGGPLAELLGGKPPSVLEENDYARSRAWVPPGHEGGVFDWGGAAYHWLIGRPLVAIGNTISATGHKPFRFTLTVLIAGTVVLIIWLG